MERLTLAQNPAPLRSRRAHLKPNEFRPGKASVDPDSFPAPLDDRSDPREFLNIHGSSPARAIRTKQSQKTWAQLFTSAGKAFEEEVVGMRFEDLFDLVIKLLENFPEVTQLAHQTFRGQHEWLDKRQIIRNILSLFYLLKPRFDQRLTA